MRWIFCVNNGGEPYADLEYDWDEDRYRLKMRDNFKDHLVEAPLYLEILYRKGITELTDGQCRQFIRERVVPPTRQNIGVILREIGRPSYHECYMLYAAPTCVMDDARVDFVEEAGERRIAEDGCCQEKNSHRD